MNSINVVGSYRGNDKEIVNKIIESDVGCDVIDGVSGDGSDEFEYNIGIKELVNIMVKCGANYCRDKSVIYDHDMDYDKFVEMTEDYVVYSE
tara:strand:- start:745 stop:1020 length:276 start_codon:yes stop_codon:yes gene_type:complete